MPQISDREIAIGKYLKDNSDAHQNRTRRIEYKGELKDFHRQKTP